MKTAGYVFLSFKSEEREAAARLKEAFEAEGVHVWWHEEIQCGQEWHGELDRAVEQASCVVVVWSTLALRSPWVRHEASQAITRGIYAPARLEVVEIDPPFNRLQAMDLMSWGGNRKHPGFQGLLGRVQQLIPEPVPWPKRAARGLWLRRGAVLSSVVAVGALASLAVLVALSADQRSQFDEQLEKLEEQEAQLGEQRTQLEGMLEEQRAVSRSINRSLFPLTNVRASFWLGVELEHPELKAFEARFLAGLRPVLEFGPRAGFETPILGAFASSYDPYGTITSVDVSPDSPLYPNHETERFANTVFSQSMIIMHFYRTPIDAVDFPYLGRWRSGTVDADLTMYFANSARSDEDSGGHFSMTFKPQTSTFEVRGSSVPTDERNWESSGKMLSSLDLAEAQVFITVGHPRVSFDEPDKRVHPKLHAVVLEIASLEGIWIVPQDIIEHYDEIDGETIYEYRFPAAPQDVIAGPPRHL